MKFANATNGRSDALRRSILTVSENPDWAVGEAATIEGGEQLFEALSTVSKHFAGAAIRLLGRRYGLTPIGYQRSAAKGPKLQAIEGAVLSPRPNPFNIQIVDFAGRSFFFPASPLRSP